VKTPNLDRLVKQGTSFTHAYNMGAWTSAVCLPSRAMLNTGAFLWRAQEYHQEYSKGGQPLSRPMWGNLMQNAGYETYFTGKWHVSREPSELFNNIVNVRPGMPPDERARNKWKYTWSIQPAELYYYARNVSQGKQTEADPRYINPERYDGYIRPLHENDTSWQPWDKKWGGFWEGGKHWSEVLADDAVSFLKKAKESDKPFFMYLAFNAPHDPRQAPKEFIEMYSLDDISIPPNFQALYPYLAEIGSDVRDEYLAPFPRSEYAVKVHRREYYALISHMDQQIGKILDELERTGKKNNTYIFFTADHGLAVGQHGLMGKQNLYDHSIRVPFIVAGPGIPKDRKVGLDIYLQDVMASAIEIAGLEKPGFVQFNSVIDLATGKRTSSFYPEIYGAYLDLQRMIRKDGFKLIVYPEVKKTLLFDLENDPWETKNLSEMNEYQIMKERLFDGLIELQKKMGDKLDLENLKSQFFN
jgi:arylsulfatase A-like enzyme